MCNILVTNSGASENWVIGGTLNGHMGTYMNGVKDVKHTHGTSLKKMEREQLLLMLRCLLTEKQDMQEQIESLQKYNCGLREQNDQLQSENIMLRNASNQFFDGRSYPERNTVPQSTCGTAELLLDYQGRRRSRVIEHDWQTYSFASDNSDINESGQRKNGMNGLR